MLEECCAKFSLELVGGLQQMLSVVGGDAMCVFPWNERQHDTARGKVKKHINQNMRFQSLK